MRRNASRIRRAPARLVHTVPVSATRRSAPFAIVVVLAAGLTACSPAEGLDQAVEDFAASIEDHSLTGFSDAAEALSEFDVEVTAADPELDGETAAVELDVAWDIEGNAWDYRVSVEFTRTDETWATSATAPEIVEGLEGEEVVEISYDYPERADITGADGEKIVTERPVARFGLDKSWITLAEVEGSAFRIGNALGIDADAFAARAVAAGDEAFVEAIALRPEDQDRAKADFYAVPGARAIDDTMLLAPTRTFARDLLGTVGEATAEMIEQSDGDIESGDVIGFSGLQKSYDERLRGAPAITVDAVAGEERRTLVEWDAEAGQPLQTTLDVDLQKKADRVLAKAEGSASLVAIRPSTGEILAAADSAEHETANASTAGQYAPGSTFKVVTALALLRAGMTPDDTVTCAKELTVDGFAFHNVPGYPSDQTGDISLSDAIAQSCNTAMIAQRDTIDDAALQDAAASLGLGVETDLGVPAFLGEVPHAESETERAADLIGQGRVLASPLAMATVAASISAEHTVTPRLIEGDGEEGDDEAASAAPDPLTADEATALRKMMRAAVTDGSASVLKKVDPPVAAKTGTAEYGERGDDAEYPTHAWLIATQGDLAVAVFVEDGGGGVTAGPLARDFLS